MKQILLARNKVILIDDEDYIFLSQFTWHLQESMPGYFYAFNGKQQAMHRIIMNSPNNFDIDHIDGNGLNNCRSNLRVCSHRENLCNRKTQKHSSLFKGVFWNKQAQKWRAQIRVYGRAIHLGYFDKEMDAFEAYKRAALKYQGEYARLSS